MRHPRGYTLIEMMICIAILAILLAAPISMRNGAHFLAAESDYRSALRNARFQIDGLRATPYDRLPPRVVTPNPEGRITLDVAHLVEGSVHVRTLYGRAVRATIETRADGAALQTDTRDPVIVEYAFHVADQGEAHTATSGVVALDNTPVVTVDAVWLAEGDRLSRLEGWSLDPSRTRLELPARAVGRVVRIDYLGSRVRNQVSGHFLGMDMLPCPGVGPMKQLAVEESYGGDVGRLRLSLLEVAP